MSDLATQKPIVAFPKKTWFVRPTSEAERKKHGPDKCGADCYTVVDTDGEMIAIVDGGSRYAFQLIRNQEALPQWMH